MCKDFRKRKSPVYILKKKTMKKRKVLFKKWIPGVRGKIYENEVFLREDYLRGTNCWEKHFTHEGWFHQWGNGYEELNGGVSNYTYAIVELPDGTITEVLPTNLKFIS
jgi:hypothetical protein